MSVWYRRPGEYWACWRSGGCLALTYAHPVSSVCHTPRSAGRLRAAMKHNGRVRYKKSTETKGIRKNNACVLVLVYWLYSEPSSHHKKTYLNNLLQKDKNGNGQLMLGISYKKPFNKEEFRERCSQGAAQIIFYSLYLLWQMVGPPSG